MPSPHARRLAAEVAATLKPLEKKRFGLSMRSDLLGLLILAIVAVSAWVLLVVPGDPSWGGIALFGLIFACLVGWVVVGQRAVGSFEHDYTALAVGRLAERLAPGLSYMAASPVSQRELERGHFLTHPLSRLVARGGLAGEAAGREWAIGYLEASRGHGRQARLQFIGLLARTESPVRGHLILRPRGLQSWLNDPLKQLWRRPQPEGLTPAFKRCFDASESDPFLVREWLTAERQERLAALAKSVDRALVITVDKSWLYVGVMEPLRVFSPALHQPLSDARPLERLAGALEAILAAPDALAAR